MTVNSCILHVQSSSSFLFSVNCVLFYARVCLCLWSTGPPLHCSSASSSSVEQGPSPPPSFEANESQGELLGNCVTQPAQESESEEEFAPNSFLVKAGSGTLYSPAPVAADGELGSWNSCVLAGGLQCSPQWSCCFAHRMCHTVCCQFQRGLFEVRQMLSCCPVSILKLLPRLQWRFLQGAVPRPVLGVENFCQERGQL